MDAAAIREMFIDQGLLKDKTNKRKEAKMYMGVYCQASFYYFDKEMSFRKACYNI